MNQFIIDNLKQGKRRLKRAYTQLQVGSTDNSSEKEIDAAPIVLDDILLSQALDDIPNNLIIVGSTINDSVDDPLSIDENAVTENTTYGNVLYLKVFPNLCTLNLIYDYLSS